MASRAGITVHHGSGSGEGKRKNERRLANTPAPPPTAGNLGLTKHGLSLRSPPDLLSPTQPSPRTGFITQRPWPLATGLCLVLCLIRAELFQTHRLVQPEEEKPSNQTDPLLGASNSWSRDCPSLSPRVACLSGPPGAHTSRINSFALKEALDLIQSKPLTSQLEKLRCSGSPKVAVSYGSLFLNPLQTPSPHAPLPL